MLIFIKKQSHFFLKVLIYAMLIIDFITKINIRIFHNSFNRFSSIIKIVLLLFLISLIDYRKLPRKLLIFYAILTSTFISSQIWLANKWNNYDFWSQFLRGNIFYFVKYSFIIILISFFLSNRKLEAKRLLEVFLKVVNINSILIVIGFIFSINVLKSYGMTSLRFGYDGLFTKVGEATYIYILLIMYLYLEYITNNSKKINLIFISIVALLLGTKAVYLFLALLLMFHLCFKVRYKRFFRVFFSVTTILVIAFNKKIIAFLISNSVFWKKLSDQYNYLTLITSTRDLLLKRAIENMNRDWDIINYFIGGVYYNKSTYVEFEFVDVFIFFGIIGVFIFSWMIFKFILKPLSFTGKVLSVIFLLISSLAGGFLLTIIGVTLFCLLNEYMKENKKLIQ